ncbi:MAG: TetR/AcrR family transcriptional regulator [Armatimonadetes bacterium]|nr:TetR/AcrR family transcriptional regulator [Armatimonadota bacterium]
MGRRKLIEDDELLGVAREVFVEQGFAASTRSIARRAGISEAVIYQRHPTKAHLFFAAMVPPAVDVEAVLAAPGEDGGVPERLEEIALAMMEYFRKLVPILLPLMTHPSFDLARFAHGYPESPIGRMHRGLVDYLEAQQAQGNTASGNMAATALTLFAAVHCLAILERLGVHGGRFDEVIVRAMVGALWNGLAPRAE